MGHAEGVGAFTMILSPGETQSCCFCCPLSPVCSSDLWSPCPSLQHLPPCQGLCLTMGVAPSLPPVQGATASGPWPIRVPGVLVPQARVTDRQ